MQTNGTTYTALPPGQNVLFFGGLVIAAALEAVRAHERIALSTLLLFGTQPRQLLLGFMLVTAFLSMWMNNTATCAVRSPPADAARFTHIAFPPRTRPALRRTVEHGARRTSDTPH